MAARTAAGMSLKNSTTDGVITFHTACPLRLLKLKEPNDVLKGGLSRESGSGKPRGRVRSRASGGRLRAGRRDQLWVSGLPRDPRLDWLLHVSLRQRQIEFEAEYQEATVVIQPILDTENTFIKQLDAFLCRWDLMQLQKKEMLHKRWMEQVWMPIQKAVENHISSRWYDEAEILAYLHTGYIHHCNTKGFVFLDTYDSWEYDPFLLTEIKLHCNKIKTAALQDPLLKHSRERIKEKRSALSCQTGCRFTKQQVAELLQKDLPHQAPFVPPSKTVSTFRHPRADTHPQSRLDPVPFHITETSTLNNICHRASCWFSTR